MPVLSFRLGFFQSDLTETSRSVPMIISTHLEFLILLQLAELD